MTADAASLHCPNCGANVAPGDQSCPYCRATLATVSCPTCFAAMFAGAAYCPTCGARRTRTADPTRRARCASCAGEMHEVQLGDTVLMECQRCHGTWLDTQTFERICAGGEAQAAVLQQYAAPPQARTMPEVRYRPCLACGKMMNRLNFGKVSGTIVDVCKGHGTFLDAGELHRIATFIRGGGLERARQRQIDELKAEEARLRALQMQRPQGHAHSDFEMPVGSWSAPDLSMLLDWLKRS